ncbi:MAG TPA: tryptophan--tRNA ligase [Patescibacteria group bacterium]
MKPDYKVDIFTGIRPTGTLTVANYLGAVAPVVSFQNEGKEGLVFVADLHALTDAEPATAEKFTYDIVADYIALGLDPNKIKIFAQSAISNEVNDLMLILARHVTVAELLRIPTLKDKLKGDAQPENANSLLLMYPVMMAADILLQRAKHVPVGDDQMPHLEMTRLLLRRFNSKYAEVFAEPQALKIETLRILSLKGPGKMSKSNPEGAIFLTDSAEMVADKIKRAQTAAEGEMSDSLKSHIIVAKSLASSESDRQQIDAIIAEHMSGKPVMGQFKQLLTKIVQEFLTDFQTKRAQITEADIKAILEEGNKIARENAQETIALVKEALYAK